MKSVHVLEMLGISKTFGATNALQSVNLCTSAGRVHALVGENGSGKSTLMKILAGNYDKDSGKILLKGSDYSPRNPAEARHLGVAMIHQELALCPHMSILDNVLLGIESERFGWISSATTKQRVLEALEPLGLASLNLETRVGDLPIAQRQLVEIARALATSASVVVLDEPTSSLTEKDVEKLFQVIRTLAKNGKSVIFISHFLNEIREVCDDYTVLRDGKFIGTGIVSEKTDSEIISMMVGRSIEDLYPRSVRSPSETVITLDHIAGRILPQEVSLQVHKGEVVGIAGLNGAGRSETLRIIFGLDELYKGKLIVKEFGGMSTPHHRWQQGVGLLSEDRKGEGLALNLSIEENITLTSLKPGFLSLKRLALSANEFVVRLGIKCRNSQQPVGELSGGNQQKVALARLLYHGTDVLLLDEPTRGIDVGSKEQIYRLIDEGAANGMAILMVSSYLPELLGVCDRIAVMRRGVLGVAHPVQDASQELLMHEAVGA